MQCADDSNGARPCIDSPGEGRLLSELYDGLLFGPAAVRSLRVGEDRRIGATLLGALRSRIPSCTSGCIFFQNRGLISPTAFSGIQVTPPSAMGFGLIRVSGEKYRESCLGECPNSMNGLILIEGPSIGTVDENVSAIDASELYRHAKETIFLLLVVGGERILVEDDGRYVTFMTRPCELRKFGFDSRDEVCLPSRKFRQGHVWHDSCISNRFSFVDLLRPQPMAEWPARLEALSVSHTITSGRLGTSSAYRQPSLTRIRVNCTVESVEMEG